MLLKKKRKRTEGDRRKLFSRKDKRKREQMAFLKEIFAICSFLFFSYNFLLLSFGH